MIHAEIKVTGTNELKKKLKMLGDKAPTAMCRAINDAAKKARTEMERKVREEYTVKQGPILSSLKIDRANSQSLKATVHSEGKAIQLAQFKTSPTKASPKRKKPIAVSVKKSGGRKQLSGDPKAFIATVKGEKIVAERTSTQRGPLKGLFGPAVPSMIKNEDVISGVKDETEKRLAERLDHYIQYYTK